MQPLMAGEVRQRVAKSVEELEFLVGLVPDLLAELERLSEAAQNAGRESEGMREEIARLQRENQGLRVERDQTVEAFSAVMHEILRLSQDFLQKLPAPGATPAVSAAATNGHAAARPSPFEREPALSEDSVTRWPSANRLR